MILRAITVKIQDKNLYIEIQKKPVESSTGFFIKEQNNISYYNVPAQDVAQRLQDMLLSILVGLSCVCHCHP